MIPAIILIACGSFIARTESARYNDAIRFVVVRDGTHTTLSVENRYRGPVEDFALLIPVPVVLHAEDVHTLDRSVFDRIEELTAPTLTHYKEVDPCRDPDNGEGRGGGSGNAGGGGGGQVRVNAEFVVGEYQVVVLEATETAALQAWLDQHEYKVPAALAEQLRPYIESGSQFFVAKVDPTKVKFVDGHAVLSPLQFDYDSPDLTLPIRLSAVNSPGVQDVLVMVFAATRFEAANRPNVEMLSGLAISAAGASNFGAFYGALFARFAEAHPGAAVTEFSADLYQDLAVIGTRSGTHWITTRLHLRIEKDQPLDDLVLRESASKADVRTQYTRRAPWTGPVECADPRRGAFEAERGGGAGTGAPGATDVFGRAASEVPLTQLVAVDVPSLGIVAAPEPPPPAVAPEPDAPRAKKKGCGCGAADPGGALALVLIVAGLRPRRARREPSRASRPRRRPRAAG